MLYVCEGKEIAHLVYKNPRLNKGYRKVLQEQCLPVGKTVPSKMSKEQEFWSFYKIWVIRIFTGKCNLTLAVSSLIIGNQAVKASIYGGPEPRGKAASRNIGSLLHCCLANPDPHHIKKQKVYPYLYTVKLFHEWPVNPFSGLVTMIQSILTT